ncbi:hypothetical protein PtA15_5A916 [Puccinia triticina]|uniref:Uncharacterized protein n=1 Tax=Puccinia triticina TaxID=208348 RepID=A0ABY7CJD2_9BASI|nr:uncharacterized protein PtA15_5A916 [Puccinia triticina]WAQ85341.1 hypothetical protein PtA15_5A916 [Puccinia triticina]
MRPAMTSPIFGATPVFSWIIGPGVWLRIANGAFKVARACTAVTADWLLYAEE